MERRFANSHHDPRASVSDARSRPGSALIATLQHPFAHRLALQSPPDPDGPGVVETAPVSLLPFYSRTATGLSPARLGEVRRDTERPRRGRWGMGRGVVRGGAVRTRDRLTGSATRNNRPLWGFLRFGHAATPNPERGMVAARRGMWIGRLAETLSPRRPARCPSGRSVGGAGPEAKGRTACRSPLPPRACAVLEWRPGPARSGSRPRR